MPEGIDVPTYHLEVHKSLGVSSSRVMFRIYHIQIHDVLYFHYYDNKQDFSYSLLSHQNGYCT